MSTYRYTARDSDDPAGISILAILSLALGVASALMFFLSLALSLLAVLVGHLAVIRARKEGAGGIKTAGAGLVLGYVGIAVWILGVTVPSVGSALRQTHRSLLERILPDSPWARKARHGRVKTPRFVGVPPPEPPVVTIPLETETPPGPEPIRLPEAAPALGPVSGSLDASPEPRLDLSEMRPVARLQPLRPAPPAQRRVLMPRPSRRYLRHLADVRSLELVGQWPEYGRGEAGDVAIDDGHAYVAAGEAGLLVLDVRKASSQSVVGWFGGGTNINAVCVEKDRAYAIGRSGFYVIDISDPRKPVLTGSSETRGRLTAVQADGRYVYIAGRRGLQIVDVTDGANPTIVGEYRADGAAKDVFVLGSTAYLACRREALRVVDVGQPADPRLLGRYGAGTSADGVSVSGRYAYLTGGTSNGYLQVVNVQDLSNPVFAGSCELPAPGNRIETRRDRAYVTAGTTGLLVIDVNDPSDPELEGEYDTKGEALGIVLEKEHAYVADGVGGLQVIDIRHPSDPVSVGEYRTAGWVNEVAERFGRLYVADGPAGFRVLDARDASKPGLLATVDTGGNANGVSLGGKHAYVAGGSAGLRIIDISDPSSPDPVGGVDLDNARRARVSGDYVYVAVGQPGESEEDPDRWKGLHVVDVLHVSAPVHVATYETQGAPVDFFIDRQHAYVAVEGVGMDVVDIRNPAIPIRAGLYEDSEVQTRAVHVARGHAYLANEKGLQVINVFGPTQPRLASTYSGDSAVGVFVDGIYAYLASRPRSVEVIDISGVSRPRFFGQATTKGSCSGVTVGGVYLYVADGWRGVSIFRIPDSMRR